LFWQVCAQAEKLADRTSIAAKILNDVSCFIKVRYSGLFRMLLKAFQMHDVYWSDP
jgi:hypothetical protein